MITVIDYSENQIHITFNNVVYLAKRSRLQRITYSKMEQSPVCLGSNGGFALRFQWFSHKDVFRKLFQLPTLMTEWALRHSHHLMKYTDSLLPLTVLPESVFCRKYLLPHAASLNCSHWASIFAIARAQHIGTEARSSLGPSSKT